MARRLYSRIPGGLTDTQRARMEHGLQQTMCMMVDWLADRAFNHPEILDDTIDTYAKLVLIHAHEGE